MVMNLIQLYDDLKSIPTAELAKYAQGSNPQVPAYMALGELNSRKQMEQQAQQFAAAVPQGTIKDNLTRGIPSVNPAAAQPMVNPNAAPQMVNPAAPQPAPQAAPQGIQQPMQSMAEGGVTTLLPYGGMPPGSQDAIDPGDMPQRSSPLENSYGGLPSVPTQGMFQPGSYAGGGIVAFNDNEDQPVDLDMPGGNTASAQRPYVSGADRYDVEGNTGEDTYGGATDRAEAPVPVPGSVAPPIVKKPSANPFAPAIEAPKNLSTDELVAEQKALQQRFGVSEDPYADAKARRAKTEARQEAKYAQDPMDRMIAQLTGIAEADPTKGVGIAMAAGAKSSKALEKEQTQYRDKAEEAASAFSQAMAKEEDSRKRGDVKGIIDAKASQQKAQFDYGKYMTELQNAQSQRISAGASASQASTAARRADLEALLNPSKIDENKAKAAHYKTSGEAALVNANANLINKLDTIENKSDQIAIRADAALSRRPEFIKASKVVETMVPGSAGYNAYNRYISDLRQEETSALKEGREPKYITPPDITPEVTKWFGANIPEKAEYTPSSPSQGTGKPSGKSDILPMPSSAKDAVFGKKYDLPSGQVGVWNGSKFVVIPK